MPKPLKFHPAKLLHKAREYIIEESYMKKYGYDLHSLGNARVAGLPSETINGKRYYNEKDCIAWHAG